jgi:hypothetical protein
VIRFTGQHAARHAGTGERWTAGSCVVPTMGTSSRKRVLFVEIDSLAPQGEAKAP